MGPVYMQFVHRLPDQVPGSITENINRCLVTFQDNGRRICVENKNRIKLAVKYFFKPVNGLPDLYL